MMISSMGGLILDQAVVKFHGIAVFQPVMNGVGGNLVAVQASRLSTAMHSICAPGEFMIIFIAKIVEKIYFIRLSRGALSIYIFEYLYICNSF
jgi:hypothetical protein